MDIQHLKHIKEKHTTWQPSSFSVMLSKSPNGVLESIDLKSALVTAASRTLQSKVSPEEVSITYNVTAQCAKVPCTVRLSYSIRQVILYWHPAHFNYGLQPAHDVVSISLHFAHLFSISYTCALRTVLHWDVTSLCFMHFTYAFCL